MRTHYSKAFGMFVAGLIIIIAPVYGAPKDKAPVNPAKSAEPTSKPTPAPTTKPSATPKKVESPKSKQVKPTKPKPIDLRQTMKQMNLKEGRNTVYNGGGVKLMADVKGGKVIRWSATDDKGKPLATKPVQVAAEEGGGTIQLCQVCVQTLDPETNTIKTNFCYYIDCKNLPPAK